MNKTITMMSLLAILRINRDNSTLEPPTLSIAMLDLFDADGSSLISYLTGMLSWLPI